MIQIKNVEENKPVYWAEKTLQGWEVLNGYYLGSYFTRFGSKHIVTYGGITSCVVRHLNGFFETKKDAWASIADMEVEE